MAVNMPMNPVSQAGKNVTRRLQRGPDGIVRLVFVDPQTGQSFINPPQGYNVIQPRDEYLSLEELGLSPTKPKKDKDGDKPDTVAQGITENVREEVINPRNGSETSETGGTGMSRDPSNNFGYINEPGVLGFTNMAPGMIGMASRGINAGINANNVAAINEARGMIGLPGLDTMGTVTGVIGLDKGLEQGKVADVSIGPNTYSVGLEALDDQGKTTLTPNEARSRALSRGLSINEVDESKEEGKGLFSGFSSAISGMMDEASSFFSGLFGPDEDETALSQVSTSQTGIGGYPDAPSPTGQENGYGVDMAGNTGTGPSGPSFGGGFSGPEMAGGFGPGYGGPAGADTSQGYSGNSGTADSPGEGAGGGPGGPSGAVGAGEDSDSDN